MKRILFISCVALFSLGAMAQELIPSLERETTLPKEDLVANYTLIADQTASATTDGRRRAKDDGVYYDKPAGSFYEVNTTSTGGIAMFSYLVIPPWQDMKFVNKSTYPTECNWYLFGSGYTGNPTVTTDLTSSADSEGNLSLSLNPNYMYGGGPFVYYGDIGFAFGDQTNEYWPPNVYCYQSFNWLAFADNKTSSSSGNMLDSGYPIGTGSFEGTIWGEDKNGNKNFYNGTFYCSGTTQKFPAPASPVYAKNAYIEAVVNTTNTSYEPIQNNAVLTLEISDTETGELLYTLTATTGDYTYWYTRSSFLVGALKFSLRGEDPLLGETEEPFVIDRACTFTLSGLEDTDNINIGMRLNRLDDCDEEEEYASGTVPNFVDKTGEITCLPTYTYYDYILAIRLDAIFDVVMVSDNLKWSSGRSYDGYSTLIISADGQTCKNNIEGADSYNLGGLYVQTAFPWYDSDTNAENYSLTETPEWITGHTVDTSNYKISSLSYYNVVAFTAEENTSEEERSFTAYVQGRGYTDTQVVTIIQEGAEPVEPDGISAVSAEVESNGAVYNLAGQRVSDSTQGVLIKDGRKVLNK